jgi:phage terminase small subunit
MPKDKSSATSESAAKRLTNKQKAFVAEYLRDFNGSRAARAVGYSERSSRVTASRMLTNANIAQAIADEITERSMGANETLLRLAEHARGDMGDFLDIGSMGYSIDLDKAKGLGLTHLLKKVKLRTTTNITTSATGASTKTETHDMEIELYSAQNALIKLAEKHGLLIDRKEITGKDGEPIRFIEVAFTDDTDSNDPD